MMPVYTQDRPYNNYTTHDGLPQIQVREVFQDSRGYIWAGTKSGLVSFNGITFTSFLPNKSIKQIQENEQNIIYINTTDGLYKYDGSEMKQIYESVRPFWFTTIQDKVWVWNEDQFILIIGDRVENYFNADSMLSGNGIYSFGCDKIKGDCYGVSGDRKSVFQLNDSKELHFKEMKQTDYPVYLRNFSNGALYLVEESDQLVAAKDIRNGELFYKYIKQKDQKIDSIVIQYLPVPHLVLFDPEDLSYFQLDSSSQRSFRIDLSMIKAPYPVIFDFDNNIWAGSDNGLYQIIDGPFRVYDRSFMNDFWTIIEGNDQRLYGASYKEGLYELDFKNQEKREIIAPGRDGVKETEYYYGASMDGEGNLYFPTHNGTVKYDYRNARKIDDDISLYSKYDPYNGQVVLGQQYGLAFVDEEENIDRRVDSTRNVVVSHTACFEFIDHNTIWLGTGNSFSSYNRFTDRFENLVPEGKDGPKKGVIAIAKDHLSNIWCGGRDGLWFCEESSENFIRIDSGLIENNIAAIIAPNEEVLIIGTSREIFALNLLAFYQTGNVEMKLYNFYNGFTAEEVCQNGFLLNGNELIIPSTTHTSVLDISKIKYTDDFSDVRIKGINANGIPFDLDNQVVELDRGLNKIEINFEPIGFGIPTTPRFSYKLEGVDRDWTPFSTRTYAYYANLSSGKYEFKVRASSGNFLPVQEEKSDSVSIKVAIPFYKEPNFYQYTFLGFLILSILILYFFRSKHQDSIKIARREQKIRFLEIATLQAQINPHFIFNFLSSVQNLISKNKPEIANAYLVKFSRLMRAYMESSIKSSKVLSQASVSHEISVNEEINLLKMYIDIEAIKQLEGKVNYKISVSDQKVLHRTIPPMIIQPLVENAIKHGIIPKDGPGNLEITFEEHGEGLKCTIKDDGIGIQKSKALKENSIRIYQSRGIELINKKIEVLNELGYRIHFEYHSLEGGTTVIVYFNNE